MEETKKNKNGMEIIEESGYNDGYYWDMRCIFRYKGKTFEFVNVGSGSGYVPMFGGIAIVEDEMLKDWDPEFEIGIDDYFSYDAIKEYADKLLESGKESIKLWDDDSYWDM